MGVTKGIDNFNSFRRERVQKNLLLIQHELDKQLKRRIQYPDFSALLNHVAEKTKIHRTTISRNPEYKRQLLNYLALQPGASSILDDDESNARLLSAKLFDARLELRNLRNQYNILLRQYEKSGKNVIVEAVMDKPSKSPNDDWYLAFNDASMIIVELIDRMNAYGKTIEVDLKAKKILDLSKSGPGRILADGARAKAFLDLYEKYINHTPLLNALDIAKKDNKA